MPTWKKLVVSGSNISQLVNDVNYVTNSQNNTSLTGSFSGSFHGDGSNITNVYASSVEFNNILNAPTLVSGSSQITIGDTTGYTAFSQSIDVHLDALIAQLSASAESSNTNIYNLLSQDITNLSSSADSHLDALLTALSASAAGANTNIYNDLSSDITNLSSSVDAHLDALLAALSASVDTHLDINISNVNTSITNLSSSAAQANSDLSASIASSLTGLSQTLSVSGSTGDADIDLKSQDFSIVGDGGGISTSVTGTTLSLVSNGIVSGSSQIDITGTSGFAAFSSSIDSHLDANISNLSSSAHSQRVSVINALSSSVDAHLDANISTVNTSISNLSGSAHSQRIALINALSSSVDAHLDANISTVNTSISNLSSSAHSQRIALYNDLSSDVSNLSGSAHSQRIALYNSLSSSVDTHLDANVSALYSSINNLSSSVDAHLDANVSVLNTSISNVSSSAHVQRVHLYNLLDTDLDNVSASFATTIANQGTDVTNLILSQSDFDTAFILNGTDVTVNGNFTVSGTTTYVNSTQIELGDNILELNGTGSNFAGLKVNDNNGPASGSLLWDGVNNYWIAGGEGSEVKILLSEGDNIVSGSSQITLGDTIGYTAFSGSSHDQRIALFNTLNSSITNLSSSVDAHLDANIAVVNNSISNLSGSAHLQRIALINALSSSVDSHLDANISIVNNSISNLSGSAHLQRIALYNSLSSSADQANTDLSASFASTVSGLSQTLTVSGDSGTDGIDLKTETLNVNGDGGGITTAIDAATNTISLVSNGVISGSSQITGDLNVDSINATSITGSSATITNIYNTNLTSVDATVTNLGGTNVNVTNITGSAASITNLTVVEGNITNITATDINSSFITGSNVNITNLNVTNVEGDSINVTNITGSSITVGDITTTGDVTIGGDVTTNNFYATTITGSVISGSVFYGDGSNLYNITVGQSATIESTFTNVTTQTVTHNFNTRNITVVVYDSNYNLIIPASVTLTTLNSATVTFCEASSGTIVVMQGGHIVSGSISANNIDGLDTAINNYLDLDGVVSSSVQIDIEQTTNYTSFSSSIDTHLDAEIANLSASIASTVSGLSQTLEVAGDTGTDSIDLKTETLNVNGDGGGISTSINSATNTISLVSNGVVSGSSQVTIGDTTGYAAFSSSIDTHLDANISAVNTTINNVSSSIDVSYKAADSALSASIASTISNLSSTLAISGSTGNDTVNLVNDSLTISGTAGEIETTVTNNQVQIGIVTNPTLTGNVTVTGDLTIQGDTIQAQVTNLNVEDRFILLNSGSNSGDSGIIFGGSDGTANEGSGIFWDSPSNVFGYSSGIGSTDVTATHEAKLGYIQQHATDAPSAAPSFQGVGSIHIKEDTGCIYIYA